MEVDDGGRRKSRCHVKAWLGRWDFPLAGSLKPSRSDRAFPFEGFPDLSSSVYHLAAVYYLLVRPTGPFKISSSNHVAALWPLR